MIWMNFSDTGSSTQIRELLIFAMPTIFRVTSHTSVYSFFSDIEILWDWHAVEFCTYTNQSINGCTS